MSIIKKIREKAKKRKITPGMLFSAVMAFQVICLIRLLLCEQIWQTPIAILGIIAYMVIEIVYYAIIRRVTGGGVLETTAFFLSGVGLFALAGATPEAVLWQLVAFVIGLVFFLLFNLFLSDLDRVMKFKPYIVALAVALLVINLALGKAIGGSQNWIRLGALSLQPSEFVKIAFILVGSTTLEKMQSSNHLTWFIVFFGVCMASLAWMGDIGTACVFFATFLVLCFLRNGRFGTAVLMCGGAAAAGSALIIAKPYIARRFSAWGHVWDDPSGLGYQQTRTLIAIASGGVLGLGPGNGVLKNVVAANNDLVFGLVSEEWGLLVASLVLLVYFGWVVLAIRGASG
ncbi:MAG: FtsW/RodA/SpoVE family cell cycle protein, partial [Oscillospiraceae bacterium]|nr:FtsW/RodA/SpoVE family cell cycle protein [Candidatus Equicaccousia limihippi]